MTESIVLTTGIYDLIKDHIRRERVTPAQGDLLTAELRGATQVLRKELPKDVVSVNRFVTIKDHALNQEKQYLFVGDGKSKPSKGKYSILSDVALATVGRKAGDIIEWPFKDGSRKIEVLKVEERN